MKTKNTDREKFETKKTENTSLLPHCEPSVGPMVNPVVESSVDVSGEFGQVHVLENLDEGGPGDGLEPLMVQPALDHVIHTLIISCSQWRGVKNTQGESEGRKVEREGERGEERVKTKFARFTQQNCKMKSYDYGLASRTVHSGTNFQHSECYTDTLLHCTLETDGVGG